MWASIASKAKDKPQQVEAAQVVTCPPADEDSTAKEAPQREGYSSPPREEVKEVEKVERAPEGPKVRRLVLDTGALIRGSAGLPNRADAFVTVREVLQEARDKKTREWLDALPIEIEIAEPSRESMEATLKVAKRTGDYGTLSAVDIRVVALAHTVAKRHDGLMEAAAPQRHPELSTSMPSRQPKKGEEKDQGAVGQPAMPGWGDWGKAKTEEEPSAEGEEEEAEEEVQEDDEEGWITPANIADIKPEGAGEVFGQGEASKCVGCMTTDFPMQNVLMHLGVEVVSVEGFRIKHLKQWVLRCHACGAIVKDTTRQFCPECGSGDTLKRVSYSVNDKGEEQIWINPNKRLNTRGTRFNLPKPRGGRSGTNRTLVLREDQLRNCGRKYNDDQSDGKKLASMLSDDWMWAAGRDDRQETHLKATQSSYSRNKGRNPNNGRRRKV